LEDVGLFDVEPIEMKPTWRNKRIRDERIAKTLDRFLVSEPLLDDTIRIRQRVSSGGESDHFPVLLEMASAEKQPPIPFKLNPGWLEEEDFVNMVKDQWEPFDGSLKELASLQFAANLKKVIRLQLLRHT
jgi:hypothetical protein